MGKTKKTTLIQRQKLWNHRYILPATVLIVCRKYDQSFGMKESENQLLKNNKAQVDSKIKNNFRKSLASSFFARHRIEALFSNVFSCNVDKKALIVIRGDFHLKNAIWF